MSLNLVSHWTVLGLWTICNCCLGVSSLQGSVLMDRVSLVRTSNEDEVASSFVTIETIDLGQMTWSRVREIRSIILLQYQNASGEVLSE